MTGNSQGDGITAGVAIDKSTVHLSDGDIVGRDKYNIERATIVVGGPERADIMAEAAASAAAARASAALPTNFIQTVAIDRAKACLSKRTTCVLLGPTGMGKSICAASILQDAPANSIWLDASTFEPTDDAHPFDMTILDDLPPDHPVFERRWLKKLAGRLVITTKSAEVAFRVLSERGLANNRDAILEFTGFTESESCQFLDQALGDVLSSEEKAEISDRLRGSPIALQALPDLILGPSRAQGGRAAYWLRRFLSFLGLREAHTPVSVQAFLPDSHKLDTEGVAAELMKLWIDQFRSPVAERLLRVLCRTSMLGMSGGTLAFVADLGSVATVDQHLASAIGKGFIRRARHHRFPDLELLVPHEVLRGYFLALEPNDADNSADERYVSYLLLHRPADPASQVDAIMVGLRSSFRASPTDDDDVATRFDRFASMLEKLLTEDHVPAAQFERIVGLFKSKLCAEEIGSCSHVIAVAHSIGFMPNNAVLAEMIWPGSRCPDAWGRGASIRAATKHWIGTSRRDIGMPRLLEWLRSYALDEVNDHGGGDDQPTVDLDLAAAIGGLCGLGEPTVAFEQLESVWVSRRMEHSRCTIAHLAILVGLSDSGRRDLTQRAVDRIWHDIPDEPHKGAVGAYLRANQVSIPENQMTEFEESPFTLTISRAAHSDSFYRFVLTRQPKARAYI